MLSKDLQLFGSGIILKHYCITQKKLEFAQKHLINYCHGTSLVGTVNRNLNANKVNTHHFVLQRKKVFNVLYQFFNTTVVLY